MMHVHLLQHLCETTVRLVLSMPSQIMPMIQPHQLGIFFCVSKHMVGGDPVDTMSWDLLKTKDRVPHQRLLRKHSEG